METHTVAVVDPAATRAASLGQALAGQYMAFQLAREVYGLRILEVRELIGLPDITRMPRAPAFIRGVINLRGRVIPVLDLRVEFGLPAAEATDQSVIIVAQCTVGGRPLTMGVLVDLVLEVLTIEASDVEPPPDLGAASDHDAFLLGVGKTGQRVVLLLDLARVLAGRDLAAMSERPLAS
jgi:purine-binding chemotaxis protein CheW